MPEGLAFGRKREFQILTMKTLLFISAFIASMVAFAQDSDAGKEVSYIRVKDEVEHATGLKVARIDVFVDDIIDD